MIPLYRDIFFIRNGLKVGYSVQQALLHRLTVLYSFLNVVGSKVQTNLEAAAEI